jgi:hypothetical protein
MMLVRMVLCVLLLAMAHAAPVRPLADTCDDLFSTCQKGCRLLPAVVQDKCSSICSSARDACKKIGPPPLPSS